MCQSDIAVGEVLAIASEPRRRLALYYLLTNERTDVDTLSVQIAAWEQDETISSVGEDDRRSVEISLYHNHLPQLEQRDLVDFDHRHGDVVRTDGFGEISSIVEELREADETADETTDATDLTIDDAVSGGSDSMLRRH